MSFIPIITRPEQLIREFYSYDYKARPQAMEETVWVLQSFADIFGLLWAFTFFAGFHGFYGLLRPSAVFCGLLGDIPG